MRKVFAVALAALQLCFLAGLIVRQDVVEKNLSEKGTEYEFAADGNFWVYGDERLLRLEIRKEPGEIRYRDRYWEIVGTDGDRHIVRKMGRKPDGAYITVFDNSDWEQARLETSLLMTEAFEQRYFPDLKKEYFRAFGEDVCCSEDSYGSDGLNGRIYRNAFTIKAAVWRGHIRFTDFLVNGESLAEYIIPEGDGDA